MTTSDIRKQCARHTSRELCLICGKHEDITQAHHVMPLHECKLFLEQGHIMDEPPVVWLCPNCHVRVHKIRAGRDEYVSRYFLEKYLELQQKRDDFLDSQFKKWEEQSDSNFYRKPS